MVAIFPLFLSAQNENGAFGGGNGIFVFLNNDLYSATKPYEGVVKINIERQIDGGKWESVAVVSSPENEKTFVESLKAAQKKMPYVVEGLNDRASIIWQDLQNWSAKTDTSNSLIYLAVQMAAGWLYLDNEAKRNTNYIYRITYLSAKDESLKQLIFEPTFYPKNIEQSIFNYESYTSDGNGLTLEWIGERGNFPSVVQAYRRDKLEDAYKKVEAKYALLTTDKGNKVIFLDRSAAPNHLYQYQLVPMDQYGNTGSGMESPVIGHYNFTVNAPVITNFKAIHSDNTLGTTLQWQYQNYELVAAVEVYRSKDYDGEYELLTTLPRNAASYRDQTVDPMDKYYYYLQVVGPLGEIGPASIRLFSIYEDEQLPTPPSIFLDKITDGAIHLKIINNDNNCEGIRVFRSENIDGEWELVSDLIKLNGDSASFVDNKLIYKKSKPLFYSAVAVNSSHVNSLPSASINVHWHGLLNDLPDDGPRNISFQDNGNSIMLYWDDLANQNLSYIILRSKMNENKLKVLTPEAIQFNNFLDEQIDPNESYEYRIYPIDENGQKRKMSKAIIVERAMQKIPAPTDVNAIATKEGIRITWNEVDDVKIASYQIYRYERGQSPVKITTIAADALTEYIDQTAIKNKLYFYYVTSLSLSGVESKPSIEIDGRRF